MKGYDMMVNDEAWIQGGIENLCAPRKHPHTATQTHSWINNPNHRLLPFVLISDDSLLLFNYQFFPESSIYCTITFLHGAADPSCYL